MNINALMLKKSIKNLLRSFGVDVYWYVPRPRHALSTLLELYKVDTVFDIGANAGVSRQYFRNIGFKGKIVSFEPIKRLYHEMERKAAKDKWWSGENVAIGDTDGELVINVSDTNGVASSFLELADNITNNAPELQFIGQERVKVKTIDSLINHYYPDGDRLFLKIDVQGFEKNVLAGAQHSLERIVGMKIEMSIVRNYQNEPLMCEMLPLLYDLGFSLASIENGWSNRATQELYQIDGILFRTDRL